MFQTYFKAAQIGFVAGMRSLMAPTLVSRKLSQQPQPSASSFDLLTKPHTANILTALAVGEIIGDKVPNMPDRIVLPEFSFRIVSGATCGAALSEAEGNQAGVGAFVGGLGAFVGTLTLFYLRQWLTHEKDLPDFWVALAEDAVAIGIGSQAVNAVQPVVH